MYKRQLLAREEMARSEDMGKYYRVPMDQRDLNYNKFFSEGEKIISSQEDYTSHNTQQLSLAEVKELLQTLHVVRSSMNA